ncbi:ferric reductase like transmembrane component-domain-containing protein [Thermothelomyces heterothallicus CBS 202.75]|uniref:ferric reductase like transmembrane component-domain-containing protein n=1 Tax=Thermothelomyces heterothallicus CBS 202.75 TaxID=1149848 RepID=UPI00374257E5
MALTPRHIQNLSAAETLEPHWGYADRAIPCTNDPGSCAYLDVVYAAHDRGMIYTGIFWLTIGGILLVWAVCRRLFPARGPEDDLIAEQLSRAQEKGPEQQQQQQQQQQPPSLETDPESQPSSSPSATTTSSSASASHPPNPYPQPHPRRPALARLCRAVAATGRRHLLPTAPLRIVFGATTRLQLLVLAVLAGYLAVWSFAGIAYARWVTPVAGRPGLTNTRTSLGPWADRVGVLAYALTPLSVLLASRESLLALLTGLPYTSFLFLHRWTGYVVLAQSVLHTLGWALVEARLYRPQPEVWNAWVAQTYAVWGVVALVLLVLLWVLSWQVVVRRVTGYEFFRKAHYVLAMVYIGALVGHWKQLQCFLVPGLVLWGLDRGARLVRTWMLHYGYWASPENGGHSGSGAWGFRSVEARAKLWRDAAHGDVVRLDFEHAQKPWSVGQHFFLCFAEGSIWQSHPFTPLSLPDAGAGGKVRHSYIFRAKGGETKKIARILADKAAAGGPSAAMTTPVVMQGPYGEDVVGGLTRDVNVLCIAGGTGITYVLPVLLRLVRGRPAPGRKMELVWAVKRALDLEWVRPEMEELRRLGAAHDLRIRTFVTAEPLSEPSSSSSSSSSSSKEEKVKIADEKGRTESDDDVESAQRGPSAGSGTGHRSDVAAVVDDFVGGVAHGPTRVFGSGPPGMVVDMRAAVAKCNSGRKVWKGEERFDVRLVCDDRLEW